jgi:hypothetical protein
MATSDMFTLSFMKLGQTVQKHTFRQYGDLVILAPFLKEGKYDEKKCIVVIQNGVMVTMQMNMSLKRLTKLWSEEHSWVRT